MYLETVTDKGGPFGPFWTTELQWRSKGVWGCILAAPGGGWHGTHPHPIHTILFPFSPYLYYLRYRPHPIPSLPTLFLGGTCSGRQTVENCI